MWHLVMVHDAQSVWDVDQMGWFMMHVKGSISINEIVLWCKCIYCLSTVLLKVFGLIF